MPSKFRYTPLAKLASGGTATVFVGARARGGASGLVALKRPHPHVLDDARQRAEVLREAHVAASLHHPNVVGVREVEVQGDEVQLVMDYVEGAALGTLIALEAKNDARIPPSIALCIVLDACQGLAAVHLQTDEHGRLLGLVHRDVSPQNILVGVDGCARLTDFGLAKAMYTAAPSTTQGTLKGKLGYMAPEYVNRGEVDRSVDVFAMGVVLWEALAGLRLFRGDNEAQTLDRVLRDEPISLANVAPELGPLDAVIARATCKAPDQRLASGAELAAALSDAIGRTGLVASRREVGEYVERAVGIELAERRGRVESSMRRWRRALWAIGSLVVLSIAGVVAASVTPREHPALSTAIAMTTATTTATTTGTATATSTWTPAPSSTPSTLPAATHSPAHRPPHPPSSSALPPNPYDRLTH
jgi:eukaryotic-like serine/threonine-protein kinase